MAIMIASSAVVAPYGLGRRVSLSVSGKSHLGGRGSAAPASAAAAKASLSPDSQFSSTRPLLSLHALFQDAPQHSLNVAQNWSEGIAGTDLGKAVAPVAASAAFFLQATASAVEGVAKVQEDQNDLLVVLGVSGVYLIIYLFVIPAIVYNYLRLRWYKRNAAETFFQFMLVFIFFPGMLLLAPFINFRRLPKEGTEPP